MTASSRSSILIVEDDTLFQSIYHTRLGEEGYAVRVANNGQDALREVEVSPPDIILLDLILPQLNGYEVLERLRADERFSQIPVIVLTNRGEPADIQRGKDAGANDYLIKTTTHPKEVLWKIRQHLAQKAGTAPALWVALRDGMLDSKQLAMAAGRPDNLSCVKCKKQLVIELFPLADRPGWFNAHLVCPQCHE